MEAVSEEKTPTADPYYDELKRLFDLYRIANLNARYYGCRAEQFERYVKGANISAALLSALALSFLLAFEGVWAKSFAAAFSGIAAVVTGVIPYFGWTEKIRDLRSLRFAYSQLFGQLEFAIAEIKRAGTLTDEHIGLARMVHEAFMRVESQDELEPDEELMKREESKVREALPPDYLETHF